MGRIHPRLTACLFLAVACARAADDPRLSPEERQREVEWLTSLGLKVPEGGLLLEAPYTGPFTARSFLVPTSWWRMPQPREVAAGALRQDLPALRVVMEKAYGGWASAQKRGWDWNRWFEEWDRELASKGSAKLDLPDALAPFGKLESIQLDNHSGPVGLPFFSSGSRSAVLDAAPQGVCTQMRTVDGAVFALDPKDPAQSPKKALILADPNSPEREGYYLAYPAKRGIVNGVQCGGKWVSARPNWSHSKRLLIANLAATASDEPSYRSAARDIGYLRLPSFTKQNVELLRKLVAALPESAGHEKLLIVDMRSNEGGDAPLAQVARWIDVPSVRKVMQGIGGCMPQSCLYTALRWGYEQVSTRALDPPISDDLRGNLQKQLDGLYRAGGGRLPGLRSRNPGGLGLSRAPRHRRASGRQTAPAGPGGQRVRQRLRIHDLCPVRRQSGSVIAGENTFGVGQFMQPGYFILPNSRIQFRIALGMSDIYGDGRSVDGYGHGCRYRR